MNKPDSNGAPSNDQARPNEVAKLFGAMLMAIGGLIMGLCGLCSTAYLAIIFMNSAQHFQSLGQGGVRNALGLITLVIPVGGLPILFGFGAFVWGRALHRGGSTS